nr:DUF262 domain-containing protein [Clostridioides sp.]
MIGIGSNKKIIDLYNEIKSGDLVLQPDFQRKLVWNSIHKENFIDTILSGLPFPEIYTAVGEIDLDTRKTEVMVVDGQQRLSTIYEYIEGVENCFEYKKIKRFEDLSSEEKKKFFYYVVVVRDIGHLPIEQIKEIFRRINSVDYALEAMEINNALYDGEYISTAKQILEDINLYSTFRDNDIARMKDLEFILGVMVTNDLKGYFTGYKEVESFVKNYNEKYPDKENILSNFRIIKEFISKLNLPEDSIWINSRSCYFTLLVELLKIADYIDIDDTDMVDNVKKSLNDLNICILDNKTLSKTSGNKYAEFYKAMYQGTSSRKNRITRGKLLEETLKLIFRHQ